MAVWTSVVTALRWFENSKGSRRASFNNNNHPAQLALLLQCGGEWRKCGVCGGRCNGEGGGVSVGQCSF